MLDSLYNPQSYLIDTLNLQNSRVDSIVHIQSIKVQAPKSNGNVLKLTPRNTQVLDKEDITQCAAQRLPDLMVQIPNVVLVQDHGLGIQVQGLDPEQTLILYDGEPILGKSAGVVDLNRISTLGMSNVELVTGAASAECGSGAVGGVLKISTDTIADGVKQNYASYLSEYNTQSYIAKWSYGQRNWKSLLGIDVQKSDGFGFDSTHSDPIQAPYSDWTMVFKNQWIPSENLRFSLPMRWNSNYTKSMVWYKENPENPFRLTQKSDENEWLIYPSAQWKNQNHTLESKFSWSKWLSHSQDNTENTGLLWFEENTEYGRKAWQNTYAYQNQILDVGSSVLLQEQSVEAERYGNTTHSQKDIQWNEWSHYQLFKPLRLDQALRFEWNENRKIWNADLGFLWLITPKTQLRAGWHTGYLNPDFRYQYMNFVNPIALYSVYGSDLILNQLENLRAQNDLSAIYLNDLKVLPNEENWKLLKEQLSEPILPQFSQSFDLGLQWKDKNIQIGSDLFYHHIRNKTEAFIVANNQNQKAIYSYRNVHSFVSQGGSLWYKWQGLGQAQWLQSRLNFQYLNTYDNDVYNRYKNGQVIIYKQDGLLKVSDTLSPSDYLGLRNRSKYQIQGQVVANFEEYLPLLWGLNGVWNGPYGDPKLEVNGSNYYDSPQESADSYTKLNTFINYKIIKILELKFALDNVLDARPSVAPWSGRTWRVGAELNI